MELNWSTFVLEIINFLVLVWVLKRFLYKPVLGVIAERRRVIEDKLAEAKKLQQEALELENQYKNRLARWEKEKQQAKDQLSQELSRERNQQLKGLQDQLALERQKSSNANERRRLESLRNIEHQALLQSAEFAARLLESVSGPELEARMLSLALDNLLNLDQGKKDAISKGAQESAEDANVETAYPLTTEQKQQLQQAIDHIAGRSVTLAYTENPELVAGLLIKIGAWVLRANVRDDLKGFAEFAYVAR